MTEVHLYRRSGKRVRLAALHWDVTHDASDLLRHRMRVWAKANHHDPDDIEIQTRDPNSGRWNSYYTK